jgi:hypothetical protein
MKIAIITAIWQRPEVFHLYAKGIQNLKPKSELQVFTVGSEGQKSKSLASQYGFRYIEYSNKNLSHKHNHACDQARMWKPDYCLFLGSDDIINQSTLDFLESEMAKGTDFVAFKDFYFYDLNTGKASYWGGYRDKRTGHSVGAGRLVSAKLMAKWRWKPFETRHSRVLDDSIQNRLKNERHTSTIVSLKELGLMAVDIKSSTNMTPFELWDNTQYIEPYTIINNFPWMIQETI